jgi:hypothetical protein
MVKRVSEAAGIGLTLVWQTIKEMEETHAVKSPPSKRNRKILFDEGLAEVGNSPKVAKLHRSCHVLRQEEDMYQLDNIADERELEFTVNTGSSMTNFIHIRFASIWPSQFSKNLFLQSSP